MAADDQRPTDDKDAAVRDFVQAARWAQRWRELAAEALDVARAMTDPQARRYMRFLSESYRLLAERAELRKTGLAGLLKALPPTNLPGLDQRSAPTRPRAARARAGAHQGVGRRHGVALLRAAAGVPRSSAPLPFPFAPPVDLAQDFAYAATRERGQVCWPARQC